MFDARYGEYAVAERHGVAQSCIWARGDSSMTSQTEGGGKLIRNGGSRRVNRLTRLFPRRLAERKTSIGPAGLTWGIQKRGLFSAERSSEQEESPRHGKRTDPAIGKESAIIDPNPHSQGRNRSRRRIPHNEYSDIRETRERHASHSESRSQCDSKNPTTIDASVRRGDNSSGSTLWKRKRRDAMWTCHR